MGALTRHFKNKRPAMVSLGYRLKALEDENNRLKRLLADATLDNAALKESLK
ncbi:MULTISPECIES: hypothetical protein [Gluconobacter]|uniref:hypothetical protein n=1 Tax=Gluconobacter TaxID=441 RepID=UPI00142D9768|nr:hypothetical protein [Gluconobacter cerinus]